MKILYIHQYFCTRAGHSGTRSYEFARRLVRNGHRVTMVTSDSDLSDLRIPAGAPSARLQVEGIDVVAVRAPYSQKMTSWERIRGFLLFMLRSSWIACRLPRHDVVLATSTPLTVGVPGLLVSFLRGTPLVFEVRDLWPEAPIQMGVVRNRAIIEVLRAFERLVYRRSTHVIALSPGMRDGVLAAGTPAEKISVIPNCSDLDLFRPGDAPRAVIDYYGLEGAFVVAYAGSMGEANAVDVLVDAAERLRVKPDVRFLLVGQGKQAESVRRDVERRGLRNVVFAGSLPRREVAKLLQASHVALVLFRDLPVLATNSPNKLFDALAAGRPVIVNSDGWTRALVETHGAGLFARPGSAESLAEAILWLRYHPEERADMGRNARRLAEAEFDREKLAVRFEAVLRSAAGLAPAGTGPGSAARPEAALPDSARPESAHSGAPSEITSPDRLFEADVRR